MLLMGPIRLPVWVFLSVLDPCTNALKERFGIQTSDEATGYIVTSGSIRMRVTIMC